MDKLDDPQLSLFFHVMSFSGGSRPASHSHCLPGPKHSCLQRVIGEALQDLQRLHWRWWNTNQGVQMSFHCILVVWAIRECRKVYFDNFILPWPPPHDTGCAGSEWNLCSHQLYRQEHVYIWLLLRGMYGHHVRTLWASDWPALHCWWPPPHHCVRGRLHICVEVRELIFMMTANFALMFREAHLWIMWM